MGNTSIRKIKTLQPAELSSFCQQINLVVKAGLPVYYGIGILRDEATSEKLQQLYASIYTPMSQGATLYSTIKDMGIFPEYMVQMIHLGEETGRQEEVLDSLIAYYDREHELHTSIRQALIFPLVMTFLMILVLTIVMAQIIPVFSELYTKLIGEPSGIAYILMNISNAIHENYLALLLLLAAFFVMGVAAYKTAIGKALFQGKGLSMCIATSHFANCMHLALSSGLDTDRALELAERLVDNPYMLDRIQNCKLRIRHGEPFHQAITKSGIFSKVYSGLLIIGTKTGSMVDVLKRICNSYEEETDRRLRRTLTILEPVLVTILSLFIGLILFTFIIPILKIILML